MITKRITAAIAVFMLIVYPAVAVSMEPMVIIKVPIDTVVAILNDP